MRARRMLSSGFGSWRGWVRAGASVAAGACCAWGSAAGAEGAGKGSAADLAAQTQVEESGFVFREIEVDTASVRAGEGQTVSLRGQAVSLHGQEVKVGDTLRAVTLQDPTRKAVAIAGKNGRVRILSVVPSLQTPTCEQQTHYLSEESAGLSERLELVSISLDTPEIQGKFAQEADIENVTFLSDTDGAAFGRAHGLLIEEPHILTRAVMVVDAQNVVRYLQVVPNVSHMPDMDAAFKFARLLVDADPE